MSIQPGIISSPGTIQGLNERIAEINRRLNSLDAARTVISAGTITSVQIEAGSITAGSIAAGAILAEHIAAGAINAGHIAANSINAGHINAGAITTDHIAADAVTAGKIVAGAIQTTHLAAGSVTAQKIAAGTITANELAAGSITAVKIAAAAVTATAIAAESVTTEKIAANAVTAQKIQVSTLSALTTNMGNLTAGTITGGTVQTATTGARVVMDSLGLRGYATDGTTKIFEIDAGTGVANFVGVADIKSGSVIPGGTITVNTIPGDRIVTNSIQTLQLAAGAVKANTIDAGAVTAQKISFSWGGKNRARNFSAKDPLTGTWRAGIGNWWMNTGATANRITTDAYDGGECVEVVTNAVAANQGAENYHSDMAYKAGVKYTASIYAKSVSGSTSMNLFAGLASANSANVNITLTTSWQRFSVTWTPTADVPVGTEVFVGVREWAGVAATFRLDAVQIEEGELPTPASRRPGEIFEGEVGATLITPNSITSNQIMAGSIVGDDIAATTITGANIAGSTITANKLSVTTLSAITADMGFITAGTITGALIRTASSGTRIVMDSSGFKQFIGEAATPSIHFKTDGTDTNVFTGTIDARGIVLPGSSTDSNQSILWKNTAGTAIGRLRGRDTAVAGFNQIHLEAYTGGTRETDIVINGTALNPDAPGDTRSTNIRMISGSGSSINIKAQKVEIDGTYAFIRNEVTIGTTPQKLDDRRITVHGARTYGIVVDATDFIGTHSSSNHTGGYDFYAGGAAANYGPFTGGHDVRVLGALADYKPGMLVASTGRVAPRLTADGEVSISSTMPQVHLAHTGNKQAVFGVFVGVHGHKLIDEYYRPETNEHLGVVNSLGEGRVLVCDLNGPIANGDYITPGAIPGFGVKQADDVLRSSTAAKATEPALFDDPNSFVMHEGRRVRTKLIACTYHCG